MHLGLIGYGSIAQSLIEMLRTGKVGQITVLVRDPSLEKSRAHRADITDGPNVTFVTTLDAFLQHYPDVIVECAGHTAVHQYAADILKHGTDLITASVGALTDAALHDCVMLAAANGRSKLIIPTGAIGGLDLLKTLSATQSVNVTYRGVKPPAAWQGSPADRRINLDGLQERTVFFVGTGREAAAEFPKNANVVAALALAGAGFDDIKVELVADPQATANTHAYDVTSDLCNYTIEIENTASPGNARTSMTTVLSLRQEVLKYATTC